MTESHSDQTPQVHIKLFLVEVFKKYVFMILLVSVVRVKIMNSSFATLTENTCGTSSTFKIVNF